MVSLITWSSYWSKESGEMKFKIPSGSLKDSQILVLTLTIKDKSYHSRSISYLEIRTGGVEKAAEKTLLYLQNKLPSREESFVKKQILEISREIREWKSDIDKEFLLKNFFIVYWWEPISDWVSRLQTRISAR